MKTRVRRLKSIQTKSPLGSPGRESLGRYLKKQRIAAGLTQADLARVLNYSSPQFVSNWERGRAQPPQKTVAKMAKLLKLDIRKVIKYYSAHTEYLLMAHFKRSIDDPIPEPQETTLPLVAYPKAAGE